MRVVDNTALATMTSPARHVMNNVHRALVNIAPEKEADFDREFDDFTLDYLDDDLWVCNVNVPEKHIRLSRKPVEVLWASGLMYFRLYQSAQQSPSGTMVEFALHPDLGPAAKLIYWAFDSWLSRSGEPWPSDLPTPAPNPPHGSDLYVADELCLCALALLMHHELAHIRLRHSSPSIPEIECDADYHAIDWILGSVGENDPRFIKRSLGCVVAFGTIAANQIYSGEYDITTHPRGFDRLVNSFDRHINDPNHLVWFTVGLVLSLHMQNSGHPVPSPADGFVSARDCVEAYVEHLSRLS